MIRYLFSGGFGVLEKMLALFPMMRYTIRVPKMLRPGSLMDTMTDSDSVGVGSIPARDTM